MRDGRSGPQTPAQPMEILPGQIWLTEQEPAAALSRLDRAIIIGANVVLYDRALAPLVARALPIGAYAEPLPGIEAATGPAISPRALDFAAEGWSVVQLVAAGPAWRARLASLPPTLLRARSNGVLSVRLINKTANGRHRDIETGLGDLAERIREFGEHERLTLIFGPVSVHRAAAAHAFTANGLAG